MRLACAPGEALRFGDMREQAQIRQVKMRGRQRNSGQPRILAHQRNERDGVTSSNARNRSSRLHKVPSARCGLRK